jgi:hypothetical protein
MADIRAPYPRLRSPKVTLRTWLKVAWRSSEHLPWWLRVYRVLRWCPWRLAREATMKPRCVACESEPNALNGCPCDHAPCVHDFNQRVHELDEATKKLAARDAELKRMRVSIDEALRRSHHPNSTCLDDMCRILNEALSDAPTPTQDRSGMEEAKSSGDFQHEPSCLRLWDLTKTCTCLKDDD